MAETVHVAKRVLILPGWQNSGPQHWQSRWQRQHGFERVEQADWDLPLRGDWLMQLEQTLLDDPRPVVLVAHSLGCQLVASWAAHSKNTAAVTGALLVAPPDTAHPDTPPQLASWRVISRQALPFASHLLYSSNDPFCASTRALAMARDWGSQATSLGAAGHINAETGLGDWPAGLQLVRQLQANGRDLTDQVGQTSQTSPTSQAGRTGQTNRADREHQAERANPASPAAGQPKSLAP